MALKDEILALLKGGLPAVLDGASTSATAVGNARPETTPPEPQLKDRDPSLAVAQVFTPTRIMIGVGVLAVIAGAIYLARR